MIFKRVALAILSKQRAKKKDFERRTVQAVTRRDKYVISGRRCAGNLHVATVNFSRNPLQIRINAQVQTNSKPIYARPRNHDVNYSRREMLPVTRRFWKARLKFRR